MQPGTITDTDLDKHYTLTVENAVLNYTAHQAETSDVGINLTTKTMNSIQLGETTFDDAIKAGDIKVTGDQAVFDGFLGMLDDYNFWFNIVTP